MYVEISLFRADRILRGEGGETMPKVFENKLDRFMFIKQEYQNILGNRNVDQISIPYWNGLDYRKKIDIPEIFRTSNNSRTPLLDQFFKEITGEKFGYMNFQNQWYQYSPDQRLPESNNVSNDWYRGRQDL